MLLERIANGDLPPGSKLNEYELAKEFEVPRTRIRDAFLALDQRGLIERIPNRGTVVSRLEPDQVFHISDVREVLEGLCARLATQNVPTESWRALLSECSSPVEEEVKSDAFVPYIE